MKTTAYRMLTLCLTAAACILITGCGTTMAPKYYALQPMQSVNDPITQAGSENLRSIDIGPVIVPEYISRSQIAVTGDSPEIYYSDLNRWSAPMEENVLSVLIQNLRPMLPEYWIAEFQSFTDLKSEYSVAIRITKFDGTPGGTAVLNVQWAIFTESRTKSCRLRSEVFKKDVPKKTYASLVETQSQLLAELSRSIVTDIQAVKKDNPAPAGKSTGKSGK